MRFCVLAETDHIGDEKTVNRIRFGLANVEIAKTVRLDGIDDRDADVKNPAYAERSKVPANNGRSLPYRSAVHRQPSSWQR